MNKIEELALAIIDYNNGDPRRIQHTTKVHAYASLIGRHEGLDEETQFILESAALVHVHIGVSVLFSDDIVGYLSFDYNIFIGYSLCVRIYR